MVGVLRCCDDLRFCTWLDSEKVLNFSYIYIYIYIYIKRMVTHQVDLFKIKE